MNIINDHCGLPKHHLELLSPAKNIEIGKEAVLHGADAVYIGGPSFGARAKADNSISDISELVQFAHKFGTKIFVTLNTILADDELEPAAQLVKDCWNAGVDALIVQDMALLKMELPPIALHASTQCDIRTVEKAKFLSHVGFSQLVLAREMTLQDIIATRAAVRDDVTLEFFIHGALCVAFSGNCYISYAHSGRSANRGTCAQECRLPYTLKDADGGVVAFDKHLLSVKDNDQSANMRALVDAGVRSFKIEGRYKDINYVKNVTAHYRKILDEILNERPELASASDGASRFTFEPQVQKTFNRESTDYFANGRKIDIGSFDSGSHFGELIGTIIRVDAKSFDIETTETLANGDGLAYLYKREVHGMQVNTAALVSKKSGLPTPGRNSDKTDETAPQVFKITSNQPTSAMVGLAVGTVVHRNRDHVWEAVLAKPSAQRKIPVTATLTETESGFALALVDGQGRVGQVETAFVAEAANDAAKAEANAVSQLEKLGSTDYVAETAHAQWRGTPKFLPVSVLSALRRDAVVALEAARHAGYERPGRAPASIPAAQFPGNSLTYLANVYNQVARSFYEEHGVSLIAPAYEAHEEPGDVPLMVTKHCLRWSFNLCPKQAKGVTGVQGQVRAEPMVLESAGEVLTLKFDCKPCEMHVMGKMRTNILNSAPPSFATTPAQPVKFYKSRPAR
jgi:23S rRNA 5-hydroxycytidine C2501 synthase